MFGSQIYDGRTNAHKYHTLVLNSWINFAFDNVLVGIKMSCALLIPVWFDCICVYVSTLRHYTSVFVCKCALASCFCFRLSHCFVYQYCLFFHLFLCGLMRVNDVLCPSGFSIIHSQIYIHTFTAAIQLCDVSSRRAIWLHFHFSQANCLVGPHRCSPWSHNSNSDSHRIDIEHSTKMDVATSSSCWHLNKNSYSIDWWVRKAIDVFSMHLAQSVKVQKLCWQRCDSGDCAECKLSIGQLTTYSVVLE